MRSTVACLTNQLTVLVLYIIYLKCQQFTVCHLSTLYNARGYGWKPADTRHKSHFCSVSVTFCAIEMGKWAYTGLTLPQTLVRRNFFFRNAFAQVSECCGFHWREKNIYKWAMVSQWTHLFTRIYTLKRTKSRFLSL